MKKSPTSIVLKQLAALLLLATPALAAYSQPASTFSAGGGVSTSANYENLGVIGQPAIVGSSSSAGYTANHGFLAVLGDGFKILYPVISATNGSFTFTLAHGAVGTRSLGIGNQGGGTLQWNITKNAPDPSGIFSVSPVSGCLTNPSGGACTATAATITANAGTLASGTYTNTLTIAGAGIEQTAQVLLILDVVSVNTFRLTVTLLSSNPSKGGGNVFDGHNIIDCSNTGNSTSGTCTADLAPDSSITLLQMPGADSTLATWSGACSGTGACELLYLNGNTAVTAAFPYASMAKLVSSGAGYESLASAYTFSAAPDTILARSVTFVEGTAGSVVTFNGGKTTTLIGGLDAYYAPMVGFTTLRNVLKVGGTNSRLNVKGPLKLKP